MELTLNTPALLFPTISLLLLAYTNRFVAIGNRIRHLHTEYKETQSDSVLQQIRVLKKRVHLIRDLQILGIGCLFLCVLSMFLIFENYVVAAKYVFGVSLVFMMLSFGMSAREIVLSTKALYVQLQDLEKLEENEMKETFLEKERRHFWRFFKMKF